MGVHIWNPAFNIHFKERAKLNFQKCLEVDCLPGTGGVIGCSFQFWALMESARLPTGPCFVRMKRTASRKLFKYLPGLCGAIFGPKICKTCKHNGFCKFVEVETLEDNWTHGFTQVPGKTPSASSPSDASASAKAFRAAKVAKAKARAWGAMGPERFTGFTKI